MNRSGAIVATVGLLCGAAHLAASGPLGVYAIVERVVFEPNDTAASEPPANPALYQTNAGMVKLREDGSHADIVKRLKDALKR